MLVNLIKYREMIKSYQNEISIHNFYNTSQLKTVLSTNAEQNILPKYTVLLPQNETKQRFLQELKKAKQKASQFISVPIQKTTNQSESVNHQPNHPPPLMPTSHYQEKKKQQMHATNLHSAEKIVDNDISFFLCSLISDLDKEGLSITDFKYNQIKSINEKIGQRKIKEMNNDGSMVQRNSISAPHTDIAVNKINTSGTKATKNVIPFYLVKRPNPGGMPW